MAKPITIPNTFASATSAIPLSQLDQDFSTLANATNDLATYSNYVADTGAADAFIANYPANTNTSSLTTGLRLQFKAANANTGASTLNVQVNGASIGTASIRLTDGSALPANTIIAGALVDVMYDGTNFQIMNDPSGGQEIISNLTLSGNLTVAGTSTFTGNVTGNVVNTTTSTITNLTSSNVTITGGSIDNISITNLTSLTVDGDTTLGDASGDTLTITGTTVTTPNGLNFDSNTLVIDAANNRIGIGTASPNVAFDVNGDIDLRAATTEARTIQIGQGRSGNGYALIDFVGDATYTDYGFRIIRNNTGANTDTSLHHRGSGILGIATLDAGPLTLGTNSSERMRITSGGQVGINTTNPLATLVVSNGSNENLEITTASGTINGGVLQYINRGTASTRPDMNYYLSAGGGSHKFYTADSERMRIDSSGNVGIGISNPAYKLDIQTAGAGVNVRASAGNASLRLEPVFGVGASSIVFSASGSAAQDASIQSGTGSSSNLTFLTGGASLTERMRIDSSGNVGIGTSSPSQKLHVAGSGIIQDNLLLQRSSSSLNLNVMRYWNGTGSPMTGGAKGDILAVGNTGSDPLVFATSDAERMRIDSSGNVAIGTSSPSQPLTVNGNVEIGSSLFTGFGVSTGDVAIELGGSRTGSGNCYIDLHAVNGTDYEARIIRSSGTNGALHLINTGTGDFELQTANAAPITFQTNATERMRIHASGGVSIGNTTNSGAASLNVSGSISGGYIAHAAGTTAMAFGSDNVVRVTPNATATYTTTVPAAGAICVLSILTSGTTSYTITFGTGFKSTGTLATGTVSARYFNITFVSDGTNLIEMSRTVAIA